VTLKLWRERERRIETQFKCRRIGAIKVETHGRGSRERSKLPKHEGGRI